MVSFSLNQRCVIIQDITRWQLKWLKKYFRQNNVKRVWPNKSNEQTNKRTITCRHLSRWSRTRWARERRRISRTSVLSWESSVRQRTKRKNENETNLESVDAIDEHGLSLFATAATCRLSQGSTAPYQRSHVLDCVFFFCFKKWSQLAYRAAFTNMFCFFFSYFLLLLLLMLASHLFQIMIIILSCDYYSSFFRSFLNV